MMAIKIRTTSTARRPRPRRLRVGTTTAMVKPPAYRFSVGGEGHQYLGQPCELGQCRSDLIGSDQSGNSTQVDGECSYRGGIRRHSAQWSTCSEHHPNNGPLHAEVAGGRNMLWRGASPASHPLLAAITGA